MQLKSGNLITIPCDFNPTNLGVTIECQGSKKVRLFCFNPSKPKTFYLDRVKTVDGKGTFEVRMPQTCEKVILGVSDINGSANGVKISSIKKQKLEQYAPCYNRGRDVMSFIKFAQEFCDNLSVLSLGTYHSNDMKYRIDLFDVIRDQKGNPMSTPARCHNKTGLIEVSKSHFMNYTVPMRMAILLHEFSHFYLNQETTDEIEADLNALRIYLGLGYPIIEAHNSFLNVFKKTPTEQNKERYQYIKAYIDNYDTMKTRLCL